MNASSFPLVRALLIMLATPLLAQTPDVLKQWESWVLRDETDAKSPRVYSDAKQRVPLWPSALKLDAGATEGKFSLEVRAFDEAWLTLPGSAEAWPQDVKINGSDAMVLTRDDHPAVKLAPGIHAVSGVFRWAELPEKLTLPPGIGILRLTANGQPVESPDWEAGGTLWMKRTRSETADRDFMSLKVYRVIEDGMPMWLRTEVELSVAGKSREEELGFALPEGWLPASVDSPIPCALDDDGELKVQVRAGKWQIKLAAFRTGAIQEFRYAEGRKPLAEQELVALQADPSLRVIELRGITSIDVTQTTMPEAWRKLPLYLWETKTPFTVEEKMRGMGERRPPGLKFERELWLDEDGGGFTWRDQLSGTGQNLWRLDAAAGQELGSVKIDGEGQLITLNPATQTPGVEVRRRNLNLTATGRAAFSGEIPATGWQSGAESLETTLHLPPGWRLLAVSGPEWSTGDWLTSWTLLDVFIVLILTLAIFKLRGVVAAAVAALALVLSWQEPDAPRWIWLWLVAALALLKVLPEGKTPRVLKLGALGITAILALLLVIFFSRQITGMLYPQVEQVRSQPIFNPFTAAYEMKAERSERTAEFLSGGGGGADGEKKKFNLAYDSKAKIQTGPAIPTWDWRDVRFGWKGPVSANQNVKLVLLPVLPQRIITFVRLVLLGALVWLLLRKRDTKTPRPALPAAPATAAAALLLLAMLLSSSTSHAQQTPDASNTATAPAASAVPSSTAPSGFPPPVLLDQLREHLLKVPDAFPNAAEIPHVKLQLTDRLLSLEARIHAGAETAVPLPGRLPAWSPVSVELDGEPASALTRRDEFLWLVVSPGVHVVKVRGLIPAGTEWQWTFALTPRAVEIEAPGWTATGVKPGGVPEAQVFFTRQQAAADAGAAYDRREFNSIVAVDRHLELGLVWQVRTKITRLSGAGKAVAISMPLLPGERVLTGNITPAAGRIEVRLGAGEKEFTWESELPAQETVTFAAEKTDRWVERWHLESSPVWNVALTGLAPVFESSGGDLVPSWNPWPGETVTLNVTRPEPVVGETTTVREVKQETQFGAQRRTTTLTLSLEASVGREFPVELEEGADIASLTLSGQAAPVRREGRRVILPVKPGEQDIVMKWHTETPLTTRTAAGTVTLPVESSNVTQRLALPTNRWVLWARGPLQGPAVRFWAVLVGAIVFGWVLGGLKFSPLRRHQWMLLLVGLTQIPLVAGAGLVAWLFWLAWRGTDRAQRLPDAAFNLSQVCLAAGVIPIVAVIAGVLRTGLLGSPTMFLLGEGSWRTTLQWYQARGGATLPQPEAFSVSIWFYRGLMLVWSLWLALLLLRLAPKVWTMFTAGGMWRKPRPAPRPQPMPPPQAGN
jgi:hypothetical protein